MSVYEPAAAVPVVTVNVAVADVLLAANVIGCVGLNDDVAPVGTPLTDNVVEPPLEEPDKVNEML